MSTAVTDVVVVGGGVIGSAIAYHLARRGTKTTLLEQWTIAAAASGASAGGVRQQGRDLRELPIAIAANARWIDLEQELDADVHYSRNGHVNIIEAPADFAVIEEQVAAQRAVGLEIAIVTDDDLRALVPGIGPRAVAGTYTANDGHANPVLTTNAFAAAAARHGAAIRTNTRVTGLRRTGGRVTGVHTARGDVAADWVVLAAGAWSNGLLRDLGVTLPIKPVGLQMILTTPMAPYLKQVVGALRRPLSLKQVRPGNYLIGGGWPGDVDLTHRRGTVRPESIDGSRATASAVFPPLLETGIAESWVGVEAVAGDEVPILGPLPGIGNLTVATGFSGHGFALSPMIGQLVSELIVDGRPSLPIDAFDVARFAGAGGARRADHRVVDRRPR